MYKYFIKRLIDTVLSICGLIVCCIPMVIIAIAIKCECKESDLSMRKCLDRLYETAQMDRCALYNC